MTFEHPEKTSDDFLLSCAQQNKKNIETFAQYATFVNISIYIINTTNRRGGSKTVPQKRLSPTPLASAVARERWHNSTRPVSRNPRATSTPRSTSMPLNAVSGCRGGRADESTAGVVDCEVATNPRERVDKACTRPLSNYQRETKRHTMDENPLASTDVASLIVKAAAYLE